jgi:3-hydroxymyristoyl/3-hydroxydecanoyl-(acyl carrier protein) dehydratase
VQIEFALHFAPDHPAFAGHFPGAPIVPGALLLDEVVNAFMQELRREQGPDADAGICQISAAKFLSPVGPGETLAVVCSATTIGSTRFDISCGNRKVATGILLPPATP